MAEGLGARGEYVRTAEQLREALKRSYKAAATENACTLINVQSLAEFSSSSCSRRRRSSEQSLAWVPACIDPVHLQETYMSTQSCVGRFIAGMRFLVPVLLVALWVTVPQMPTPRILGTMILPCRRS